MTIVKHSNKTGLFIVIFIAVFFSSILGAQFFGVSLNKLALLPLECFLIYLMFTKGRIIKFYTWMYPIALFYIAQILGSLFGLLNAEYIQAYEGYADTLINNIIQDIFIYIPILLLVDQIDNKQQLFFLLEKAIIYVARIHLYWIITQFVLWNIFHVDFNEFIFKEVLKGQLGEKFGSTTIFLNGEVQLRATGLNYEPAAAATIMMLGICFDKNIVLKLLYTLGTVLGMSRTGIVVAVICLVVQFSLAVYTKKINFSGKKLIALVALLVFLIIILFVCVPSLREQVLSLIDRFTNIGSNNDGSERHIMYPIYSLYSWMFDLNLYQKIFGVGARVSGIVFVESPYVSSNMTFQSLMLTSAWEVECDYAAILLGDGILGAIAYLWIIIKYIKSKNIKSVTLGIAVLCFGLMYNTFSSTLFQIVTIIFLATNLSSVQLEKNNFKITCNQIKRIQ